MSLEPQEEVCSNIVETNTDSIGLLDSIGQSDEENVSVVVAEQLYENENHGKTESLEPQGEDCPVIVKTDPDGIGSLDINGLSDEKNVSVGVAEQSYENESQEETMSQKEVYPDIAERDLDGTGSLDNNEKSDRKNVSIDVAEQENVLPENRKIVMCYSNALDTKHVQEHAVPFQYLRIPSFGFYLRRNLCFFDCIKPG